MDVSVIIPCHNAEPYLAQAIGSVLEQTELPREVIVIDDGSIDRSLEIARRFEASSDGRVQVRSEPSGNACRTRNVGASIASGDALMFLDADDVLAPDTIVGLASALVDQPGSVAICPWKRLVESAGQWVERPPSCAPRVPGDDPLSAWLTGWYHPPCSVLWSKDAFERAGRWDERSVSNQDGDLMMRALALGIPVVEASTGTGYYRRPPEGQTTLSGARFSHEGVTSRLRAVEKVAAQLELQGRLHGHAAPIQAAFTTIATDLCGGYPDLYQHALAQARTLGPAVKIPGRRRLRHGLWQWGERAYRRTRRWIRLGIRRLSRRSPRQPSQVMYGLRYAEHAVQTELPPLAHPREGVDRPAVTVVVPTYNRARLIRRAIDSVLAQTFGDFEILVIDDGSTDATAAVIAGYDDARIRYLPQHENRGVSAARNRGLREARGEFIAFLDSDDEWLPKKLALQVERLRDLSDDVGLIYGGVENHAEHGHRDTHVPSHRGDVYRELLTHNVIHGTSSVVIRRCVVASAGFFDEDIPAIEDYDYWVRVGRFFHVDYIEEPVIRYHDPGTLQERKSLNVGENLDARAWFYGKHANEMRRAGVAHRFLLISVRRHLADGDSVGARALAIRAIIAAPTCWEAYRRAAGTVAPKPLKDLLKRRQSA